MPTPYRNATRAGGLLASAVILASASLGFDQRIPFIGVYQDQPTSAADERLIQYLEAQVVGLKFSPQEQKYGVAIDRLQELTKEAKPYLARMTPYAYVAAEMLGADMEVLGVYVSNATGTPTYRAWFVVNKEAFDRQNLRRDLGSVRSYVGMLKPARFIYHSRFSTSSYFLPSLHFRRERIFRVTNPTNDLLTNIQVQQISCDPNECSSSQLVKMVAGGEADLAAVADATVKRFSDGGEFVSEGKNVYFIPLPTVLPNDLLVCSPWLDDSVKRRLQETILPESTRIDIANSDFKWWQGIKRAPDAQQALDNLRRLAADRPAPATVSIQGNAAPNQAAQLEPILRAAQRAVRLSGTEFVLRPPSSRREDVTWTLELTRSGTIVLTSKIEDSSLKPQQFRISFSSEDDLTKRIIAHIQNRMRRIRYVWPYQEDYPVVIRDVGFTISEGTTLEAQEITWSNPDEYDYTPGTSFPIEVAKESDFHKIRLTPANFPITPQRKFAFDPMSNVAYRVILDPPSRESSFLQGLTVAFVVLLGLGAVFAVIAFREPEHRQVETPELFRHACQEEVKRYHQAWQERPVLEASILWCDRARIREFINELEYRGQVQRVLDFLADVIKVGWGPFSLNLSSLKRFAKSMPDPDKVGGAVLVKSIVGFLVGKRLLSPFVGRPLEWDALNGIASWVVCQFRGYEGPASNGDGLLREEHPAIAAAVSKHFQEVVNESLHRVSFFREAWEVRRENGHSVLRRAQRLRGQAQLRDQEGAVDGLLLEVGPLTPADDRGTGETNNLDAWVLGEVIDQSVRTSDGVRYLYLHFKALAVLRG